MSEPKFVYAGDTVTWTRSLDEFPAPTWTLTYSLVKDGDSITVTATPSGADHLINATAATTAVWRPGEYRWTAYVTSGATRHTVDRGTLTVRPDPASGGYDTRSVARVMLENIETYLKDPNNIAAASYSINNRSLSRWARGDLLVERDKLKLEVMREEQQEKLAAGLDSGSRVYVRFGRA